MCVCVCVCCVYIVCVYLATSLQHNIRAPRTSSFRLIIGEQIVTSFTTLLLYDRGEPPCNLINLSRHIDRGTSRHITEMNLVALSSPGWRLFSEAIQKEIEFVLM